MKNLLFTLLLPSLLAAQKDAARLEIEQINRTYAAMTQLHTEVDYIMYATHQGGKPIDNQSGTLWRNGDFYLYKLGSVESLTTPEFRLNADHEDKELLLDRVRDKPVENQFGLDLNTALDACEVVAVSIPAPGLRLIRLDLPLSDVERAEFLFDALSRKMQKVTLFYRNAEEWEEDKPPTKARLEIRYRKQDEKPVFAKNLFSLERFVRRVNGAFATVPAFSGYVFFDNTNF